MDTLHIHTAANPLHGYPSQKQQEVYVLCAKDNFADYRNRRYEEKKENAATNTRNEDSNKKSKPLSYLSQKDHENTGAATPIPAETTTPNTITTTHTI